MVTKEKCKWATFEDELASLINKYSLENESNTPDFMLAAHLVQCLKTFNQTSRNRERWYGKELTILGDDGGNVRNYDRWKDVEAPSSYSSRDY